MSIIGNIMNNSVKPVQSTKFTRILLMFTLIFAFQTTFAADVRWIAVGSLHNFYQSHGSEPEEDYGAEQQWGFRWPAFYLHQDMQAARGFFIALQDYDDPLAGTTYAYKVAHVGPRPRASIELNEFMPVEFYLQGRFKAPAVVVDGEAASDLDFKDNVDEFDSDLVADRILVNTVNSSTGITMHRKIYAYSQQYHDNFFIVDYTFTNTGIWNKDGSGVHNQTLDGVYFHWQYRNAVCGEGTTQGSASKATSWSGYMGWGMPNDTRWGINTMNDVLGETPDSPKTTPLYPNSTIAVDEFDDSGNIMRCFYSWQGKHPDLYPAIYDNIGSPNWQGYSPDGRLGASQFTGVVTIHADKSATDNSDDVYQPSVAMNVESNDQVTTNNDQFSATRMEDEYLRVVTNNGEGHQDFSHAEQIGDGLPVLGGGGQSQSISFGPYRLEPGQSIRIVLGEAANGLSRKQNIDIGGKWFDSMNGVNVTMEMPDGSTTDDHDMYKDSWVFTGKDSLVQSFRRLIKLYSDSLSLGDQEPPEPPNEFTIESQGNRILLTWTDNATLAPHFEGYKIYRALGEPDSTYYEIFDCNLSDGNLVHEYADMSAARGQSYYYYIVSYDDGSVNTIQPGIPLRSSLFYTKTNKPASLKKPPELTLKRIRIVPNPFNVRNNSLQYVGEPNRVMFLNLPEICEIKIFTERGDLIYSDLHEGSGDFRWDLLTSSRQIIVSGLYIVTFYVPRDIVDLTTGDLLIRKGESVIKKFVVIR